jgi:acetyl-CoA acyltransferase
MAVHAGVVFMFQAVITDFLRSPFVPARKGPFAGLRPDDLAAEVVKALVARAGIDPGTLEDLMVGCAFPEGEQGMNLARLVGLLAGLPKSVGGVTINRYCGSSMQSVHDAAGAIAMGSGEAFICAGVESMSRVPMMGFNPLPNPKLHADLPSAYIGMGETAENVARRYKVSRADQEAFAALSHHKAAGADFAAEIAPVAGIFRDQCIRPGTTAEILAALAPVFDAKGTVTAGTSSPLTDGAAALMLTNKGYATRHGLKPMARVVATAVSGCDPAIMGMGPVGATRKALKRAKLEIKDIDIVEINEAFAAQALACIREIGIDEAKVNLDGGAIAIGHPLGASGARITGKAAALLKREKKQFALATMCIGGGQGIATILEAL